MNDPYEVLGVSRNASQDEIERAYRSKAMEWHPDRHVNGNVDEAAKKFKEINAAFQMLSDVQKRENFDRFGNNPFPGGRPFTSPIDDFMRQFFGGMRPQRAQGNNIVVENEITLEDVFHGCDREIRFQRRKLCEKCRGSQSTCGVCNGSGFRIIQGAAMTVRTSCQNCGGTGMAITSCGECQNGLKSPEETVVNFKIPRGVESGMRFVYQGMGEPICNGVPGDLYVVVKVKPHDVFQRLANGDVLVTVPVTYSQLVLGDEILVPTLTKEACVKISSGTQSGSKFRLNEMGLPKFNDKGGVYKFGDEIVQLELEVPINPEGRYRELIVELAEIEKQNVSPKKK